MLRPPNKPLPPIELLQQLLTYCPETGQFRWTAAATKKVAGKIAGAKPNGQGYGRVCIANTKYHAHRLAWYMHYQQDPGEMQIDHVNCDKMDNRICNLRLATQAENCRNTKTGSANKSGYKGVSWHKKTKKWQACIVKNREYHYLGLFDTAEEAAAAAKAARAELHLDFARHK